MPNQEFFERKISQATNVFYFRFIGTPKKDNIAYQKINEVLDQCFNEATTNNNLLKNISWLRTILKDFEESLLMIELLYPSNIKEKIVYINKEMNLYKKYLDEQIIIKYDLNNNPNLSLNVNDFYINNSKNYKLKMNEINSSVEKLQKLAKVKPIELTINDKVLCLVYKNFYGEYPNFITKDTSIKIQTMVAILASFGICLSDDYSFMMNSKNLPISITLSQTINKLQPIGQIESIDKTVVLNKEIQKYIEIIGKVIKESITPPQDELEILKRISIIAYFNDYCLPSPAAIDTMALVCKCSTAEIESGLKLIKKIERKCN